MTPPLVIFASLGVYPCQFVPKQTNGKKIAYFCKPQNIVVPMNQIWLKVYGTVEK
jgi:hypothetical protein